MLADRLGTATRLGGDSAQQITIAQAALMEGGKIGIGRQEQLAVDRFQVLGGRLDRFFESAILASDQQLLTRQAGLIALGRQMPANADDDGRLASANGAVFHLAIDLVEIKHAVVIAVPAGKMLVDELVPPLLFLRPIGWFLGGRDPGTSSQQEGENRERLDGAHKFGFQAIAPLTASQLQL